MAKNINVQRVGVNSIGRLVGTVNLIVAIVVGLIGSIVAIFTYFDAYNNGIAADIIATAAILVGGLLLYPLVMFLFGWLYGCLIGLIFNLVVGVSGGVDLTVADEPASKK